MEFILFALTLLGVALFHHYTLAVALTGLASITVFKLAFTGFKTGPGFAGLAGHLGHEWVMLTNLLGLLLGFALLARHFEDSRVPKILPRFLPAGWPGGFVLLALIFVLSSFLDNIAAALIGGTVAAGVFRYKVHIGYLAAIVAASNAGGSGSVVGDTTTTMMWISGVAPAGCLPRLCRRRGGPGGLRHPRRDSAAPLRTGVARGGGGDDHRLGPAGHRRWHPRGRRRRQRGGQHALQVGGGQLPLPGRGGVDRHPAPRCPLRKPEWSLLPEALKGSLFLLSLVLCASMMPVERLPPASWLSALSLGFVSAVFDNIPLTALALKQGGFDWGMLAYCGGLWRVHDLVRQLRRGRPVQHVSPGQVRGGLAARRLACDPGLCDRLRRPDADPGLAAPRPGDSRRMAPRHPPGTAAVIESAPCGTAHQ